MIYPIVRMYASTHDAEQAHAKLKDTEFPPVCHLVTPVPGRSEAETVAAITAGMVLLADAKIYAKGVLAGRSLLIVDAAFGTGRLIMRILDASHPVDSGVVNRMEGPMWNESTPFSSLLGIPTLSKRTRRSDNLWHRQRTFFATLGLPDLTEGGALTSPSLIDNGTLLSGLIKLPVLIRR
jgi:hypothetical protein